MRLYSAAILAFTYMKTYYDVLSYLAEDEIAAMKVAMKVAHNIYPPAEEYYGHQAIITEANTEDIIKAARHIYESRG